MGLLDAPGAPITTTQRTQVVITNVDVTLTSAQVASRLLDLSGATAAVNVLFPTGTYTCRIRNSTDYPQTLKRVGGTGTLTIDAGSVIELQV